MSIYYTVQNIVFFANELWNHNALCQIIVYCTITLSLTVFFNSSSVSMAQPGNPSFADVSLSSTHAPRSVEVGRPFADSSHAAVASTTVPTAPPTPDEPEDVPGDVPDVYSIFRYYKHSKDKFYAGQASNLIITLI